MKKLLPFFAPRSEYCWPLAVRLRRLPSCQPESRAKIESGLDNLDLGPIERRDASGDLVKK
jgi:hypothetical protein